ncbi:MAG: 2-(1,2-epoxy-1,2-dihydrophenyl)acetyl-CoA isomerase [Bacteroidetes bacterium]|nr:MAG: 2-(1,2-epoxy-1,2-dihydrophenyl)acetyl-CoA isomerase [Bacteroidota bacterium]MBL1145675.1 2-(1,2-epoxy-1,2-dihydrophenyl)acetyl-CoA isomerase [Bacteroidota bacterium]NOG58469.1 2-(1,2-epoxy-1,2-dihydrophenyl)acetyl-CoA isomerase [Bacteroidota bacterium]
MNPILLNIKNGIARITLNRPKSFNSFNREMALALQNALDDCHLNKEVRVIVLTGEGKAFCAGQDLVEVTDQAQNPGFRKILDEHYSPIIQKIRTTEKPIIAAVNGVAAGAGANIALACDIVVAHEKVSFIQAFSGIGLIPDSGGTFFLPRLIGFQKASALAMLGDKVSAEEAEKMGMIYKVFSLENFEEEVTALANRMATMPTKGLALTKQAFNLAMSNSLDEQLVVESKLQIEASETHDYHEGVAAFLEKRKPVFKGE